MFVSDNKVPGQGADARELFEMLELSEADVNVLYGSFCAMAGPGSTKIELDRILLYCKIGMLILL